MRLSRDYVWEKLYAGVSSIAEADMGIKERLANAYISQLVRLEETAEMPLEIPEPQADKLRNILARLSEAYTSEATSPYGDFEFDADEAAEIIGGLVEVYDAVCRLLPAWEE